MKFLFFILLGFLLSTQAQSISQSFFDISKIKIVFKIASYLFLFSSGLELSLKTLNQNFLKKFLTSIGIFFGPTFLAYFIFLFIIKSEFIVNTFFVAMALSVCALPVIIQILKETDLYTTKLGASVVSYAVFSDIFAWFIFAFMLPSHQMSSWAGGHLSILLFFTGILLSSYKENFNFLFVSSQYFWAPLFFVGVGFNLNLNQSFSFQSCLEILFLALFCKSVGVYIFGKMAGYHGVYLQSLVFSLNARGAMEILLAHFAYEAQLINQTVLTSLIVMSLLTSVIASVYFSTQKIKILKAIH